MLLLNLVREKTFNFISDVLIKILGVKVKRSGSSEKNGKFLQYI